MAERFSFTANPPSFAPPAGACDCHTHVFGPFDRYPLGPDRAYVPMNAVPEDARTMMDRIGLDRIVLVQPSPYGPDNRRMLDAMAELGAAARGVAVVDETTPDAELDRLHAAGVRGVRLNIATGGNDTGEPLGARCDALARQVAGRGWHLQLFIQPNVIVELEPTLMTLPVPCVIDHMGLISPAAFRENAAFEALLRLLDGDNCWVKLSGAYRVAKSDTDFAPVAPLAQALVAARPDRLVWGSDWPHTPPHAGVPDPSDNRKPYRNLDTGELLGLLEDWAPDEMVRNRILVDNPARLYDF